MKLQFTFANLIDNFENISPKIIFRIFMNFDGFMIECGGVGH